ncbi:aminopeptidase P family protein [candidate division KSB1 bacterium]|nr:MAG: aminopeptidase P family protein [candidate division KSB1 bacterium]
MELSRRDFIKVGGITIATSDVIVKNIFEKGRENEKMQELKNMVKDVKPLELEDYLSRIEKAKSLMAKFKIDCLFLTGGTNLIYFTNVNWWRSERVFGVLLFKNYEPVWICPSFELERAKEKVLIGKDIRTWEEHENPYKLIKNTLKEKGLISGNIGIEESVRYFVVHELKKEIPSINLMDGRLITQGCRAIKNKKEIAYMDLANRITKLAYQYGFNRLKEGMSPGDLSSIIGEAHRKMGVTGGGSPSFGENSAFPHGTIYKRNLKSGDIVLVDGGCSVQGYRSDVTRTIVFGKPSRKQKKIWEIVRKAQIAALNKVRPGIPCEEIDKAARKVIEDAGFGPDYKYFTHRLGHGIGMDGHEYPYLVMGNRLKLQPGMTFSDEPGIYIYGEFGVRIEDCFVVTEEGGRFLGDMASTDIEKPFG